MRWGHGVADDATESARCSSDRRHRLVLVGTASCVVLFAAQLAVGVGGASESWACRPSSAARTSSTVATVGDTSKNSTCGTVAAYRRGLTPGQPGAIRGGSAGAAANRGSARTVAGRSLQRWEALWWRWDVERIHTYDTSPPPGLRCAAAGQHGPVWFLAGDAYPSASLTRRCVIPRGMYIMIGGPAIDCSTIEPPPFHASNGRVAQRCARRLGRLNQPSQSVTVDGKQHQAGAGLLTTGPIRFRITIRANMLGITPPRSGIAAVSASPVMLSPLLPGRHVLRLVGGYAYQRRRTVTYLIDVEDRRG
jgi:hypothetical protein